MLVVFIMCSDNVKVTMFRSYCSSLYTSQLWWKYKVKIICSKKMMHFVCYSCYPVIVVQLLSGMFAVHNVMSGPAPVRKLVFVFFYKRVKASQNYIVQAMCI